MKKSLALILTFIMVLALVPSGALAEGEEGKVTITKALVSSEPDNDGNYTIKLTVQGDPVTQNVQPNADVVLVIDCSGSMDENNRMKTAKKAGKEFAGGILKKDSGNKMAVIGFSSAGVFSSAIDVATDLTDNQNTILSAINSMRADSGTDYTAALTKAKQILGVRNSRPNMSYSYPTARPDHTAIR